MLLLRLGWSWQVERSIRRQFAELKAKGEPTSAADFAFDPLSDEQNAWTLQNQAALALSATVDSPSNGTLEYREYPPYPPAWNSAAAASEKANAASLVLIRQARARPQGQFRKRPTLNINTLGSGWSEARQLANTVSDGAVFSHMNGDDTEALERIRDCQHLARSVHSDEILVSQLVAAGIDALASCRLQIIAPGLRFSPAPGVHPATAQQVRAIVADLLDERQSAKTYPRTMLAEILFSDDYLSRLSDSTWVTRPLARTALDRSITMDTAAAATLRTKDMSFVQATVGPRVNDGTTQIMGLFSPSPKVPQIPNYAKWYELYDGQVPACVTLFRVLADRRVAATSLAIQLYRSEHQRWPATLAELVPAYLQAVPLDPLQGDLKPIGYLIAPHDLPDGSDRPLLYWDPANVCDFTLPKEPAYSYYQETQEVRDKMQISRQYRDLSRWEPKATPP